MQIKCSVYLLGFQAYSFVIKVIFEFNINEMLCFRIIQKIADTLINMYPHGLKWE